MDQEKIGKFIYQMRKTKNLTQEELAEKLGVSNKSISRWENGITMPDISMLLELAEKLDVEVSELLNGRKMTKEELVKLKETIENVIVYTNRTDNLKKQRLNKYFMAGLFCILVVILNNRFDVLGYIFKKNIDEFVAGVLCGLGLLFEFIGFYNNNHSVTLKRQKKQLIKYFK